MKMNVNEARLERTNAGFEKLQFETGGAFDNDLKMQNRTSMLMS
jgi:hypothetical protein